MTTRGMTEEHFVQVGKFLLEALAIAEETQKISGKKMKDFTAELRGNKRLAVLQKDVLDFVQPFPMPGVEMV